MTEQFPDNDNYLYLEGELQINTAIDALQAHAMGSSALNLLTDFMAAHNLLIDTSGARPDFPPALYVENEEMKKSLVDSLHKRLEQEDLDDFQRIGTEELLAIQENLPPDL